MSVPNVSVNKSDNNTGVVQPSNEKVLAIIAPSSAGVLNQPASYTRQKDLVADKGIGELVEFAAYYLQNAKRPVVVVRANATTAGAYGSLDQTGKTGTSVITTTGTPVDEYESVVVQIVKGGTVGTPGITYKATLDGGGIWSGEIALGAATSIALLAPRVGIATGVAFNLGVGTLNAGDRWTTSTTRPQMNTADLQTALEALRTAGQPWAGALIAGDADASKVSVADSWLSALEGKGVFKELVWMNTRHKSIPVPTAESEAAFATSMTTLRGTIASTIRIDVGADAGDVVSAVTGLTQARPVALGIATRALPLGQGVDPAELDLGPIPGFSLADDNGNPKYHDEALFPGLDDLGFSTLRSVDGDSGAFINNARILSPSGSDYVYDQHARTMNVACSVAYQRLKKSLSRSVRKRKPDPITGAIYILEQDAAAIDADVSAALRRQLKGQVNDVAFVLSRTDDLSSNDGATCDGDVEVQALAYIKNFVVTAKFVRTITVPLAA